MDDAVVQHMLKTIFPGRGEGTVVVDSTGTITHIDCPAIQHLGYGDKVMAGIHISALMPTLSMSEDDSAGGYKIRSILSAEGKTYELPSSVVHLADRLVIHINFQDLATPKNRGEDIRSVFVSRITHEIRTPLHEILGTTDLLRATKLDRVQEHYVNTINRSASTLLHTFENILELADTEQGGIVLNNVEFAPIVEFEALTQQFIQQAEVKGIALMFFIDPKLPAFVEGDIVRVRQVLLNIISNAVKFTPEGGEIKLRMMLEKLDDSECLISFIVTDNGEGIDVEVQDNIFEAFSGERNSNTAPLGSVGTGLAISKSIVDAMQGQISFVSEKNIGTTFLIELPFKHIKPERTAQLHKIFSSFKIAFAKSEEMDVMYKGLFHKYMSRLDVNYTGFSTRDEFDNLQVTPDVVFIFFNKTHAAFLNEMLANYSDIQFVIVLNSSDVTLLPPISDNILDIFFIPPKTANILTQLLQVTHEPDKILPLGDIEKIYEAKIPLSVLVAEDNPVGQEIICSMLKTLGAEPSLAINGVEAFEKFKSGSFDLVLMDINMPVLDGNQSARLIRGYERMENKERTPIVAVTANTVWDTHTHDGKPDIDECMFKPVNKHTFYLMLRKYHSLKEHFKRGRTMSAFTYDVEKAAKNIGIDSSMMLKFVGMLVETLDDDLAGIGKAVEERNFEDMHALGHRLKGAAANLGVEPIAESCKYIESNARNKNDIDYNSAFTILEENAKLLKEWYKEKTQK